LNTSSCELPTDNDILNFGLFESFLNHIYTWRGKHDLSKYSIVLHSVIQSIAGFATFLPIDMKELLCEILHVKDKRRFEFDILYEIYRIEIYRDFVSRHDKDGLYHYERNMNITGKDGKPVDPPYDLQYIHDAKIPNGLWPPPSLLEKIKKNHQAY
jgi:hypothetical protein